MMTSNMTRTVAGLVLLPAFIAALALVVKGYTGPGDGFAAGMIVGIAVLIQYLAFGPAAVDRLPGVRQAPLIVTAGLLLAFLVGFWPVVMGEPPFTHAPAPDAEVITLGTLELHTSVLFDIGIAVMVSGFSMGLIDALARSAERRQE